jgi:hypothetical protein
MSSKAWNRVKQHGSGHYKAALGQVEPIDLMRSTDILWNFAIGNIIKYACRNKHLPSELTIADMDKIIHYCNMLKIITRERNQDETRGIEL